MWNRRVLSGVQLNNNQLKITFKRGDSLGDNLLPGLDCIIIIFSQILSPD